MDKKKYLFAIVGLVFLNISCLCTRLQDDDDKKGVIEGRVLLFTTKDPIENIRIRLSGIANEQLVTLVDISDKTGRYKFSNLSPGKYSLEAQELDANVFAVDSVISSDITKSGRFSHEKEIQLKQEKIKEDVLLIPASTIFGKVTLNDGTQDKESTPVKATIHTLSMPAVKTDDKGCYKIVGLNALKNNGNVTLEVKREIEEEELKIFFGIIQLRKAIKIETGKSMKADFVFKNVDIKNISLQGKITVKGQALEKKWVKSIGLYKPNIESFEFIIASKFTEDTGEYKFYDVEPGECILSVNIYTNFPKTFEGFKSKKKITIVKKETLTLDIDLTDDNFDEPPKSFEEELEKLKQK